MPNVPVRISLFGQPRVEAVDGSHVYPLVRKTLNVLGYLVLHRQRPVIRDTVAFAIFPDEEEESARNNLRRNLSYLLSSLPPRSDDAKFVRADHETIAWNEDSHSVVDVIAFEQAVAEGRDDDAIAAYGGDLLPTLYDDWTSAARERLRDAFHSALTRTIARDRSVRKYDRATERAHRLLDEDPWREDIVREVMAIRYEAGDRAGALSAFERFAAKLSADMHAEPMPETFAVRDAILRGARLATSEPEDRHATVDAGTTALTLAFAGREDALKRAIDVWHTAADGRASVLFVSGQAGIGKSRFAAELARAIEREGGIVVRGETSPGGEHRPYEAFVDALRSSARLRTRSTAERKRNAWEGVLEELLDEQAHSALGDDRAARIRLFDAVRAGLADLSRTRPVAVIFEDMHWAGTATIDLLEFIATRLGRTQILLVVTFRSVELAAAHPLRPLRRQLTGRGSARDIALGPLDVNAARAAARGLDVTFDAATLDRAVEHAAGVPLLLVEALRDSAAGRDVGTGGIEDLFGSRLAQLSPSAETALAYGAVVGARFDLNVLAATTGWSDDELVDALAQSIDLGLVRAGAPGFTFAFTHHLVQGVVLERLGDDDRKRAHAFVARALASLPRTNDAGDAEIARHYLAAGVPAKALEHLLPAARYAMGVFANHEACEIATTALNLLASDARAPVALKVEFLTLRERAYARIGDLARNREDALALVVLTESDADRSATSLERAFDAYRDDATMRKQTLEKLEALAAASDRNAAIFERASAAYAFTEADYSVARDAALRAAALYDRIGSTRDAFFARAQYITALCRLDDFESARAAIAEQRSLCESSDDLEVRMEFHRIASSVSSGGQRLEAGLADARVSLELALRVGDRLAEAQARHNVVYFLAMMSEYEQAIREQERALTAYTLIGDATGVANTLVNLASIRGFCGDHAGAEALLSSLTEEALAQPYVALLSTINRACFALRSGDVAGAEPHLVASTELAAKFKTVVLSARIALRFGEFYARTGSPDRAIASFAEALETFTSLDERALMIEAYARSAHLRATIGDADVARDHAGKAAALAENYPVQHFAEFAWLLSATYATLGDAPAARLFAERAALAFVDEALRMDADLAEAYAQLSWHRDTVDFLNTAYGVSLSGIPSAACASRALADPRSTTSTPTATNAPIAEPSG
jgi:DNA-binding SARP family transcriptional activator